MKRKSRNRSTETFAQIPLRVMASEAFRTLRSTHKVVLFLVAAQYRGTNNGDLALTRSMARELGVTSEETRSHGLRELAERGLIVKSYQGGMRPFGPTRWALTWKSIDYLDRRKLEHRRGAPDTWKKYSAKK